MPVGGLHVGPWRTAWSVAKKAMCLWASISPARMGPRTERGLTQTPPKTL